MRVFPAMLICVLLAGCEMVSPESRSLTASCEKCGSDLSVHLQSQFDRDRVMVQIDDDVAFDGRVTTLDVLSLAETFDVRLPAGPHRVTVRINRIETASTEVDVEGHLYLLVSYFKDAIPAVGIQKGISFEVTEHRPVYD